MNPDATSIEHWAKILMSHIHLNPSGVEHNVSTKPSLDFVSSLMLNSIGSSTSTFEGLTFQSCFLEQTGLSFVETQLAAVSGPLEELRASTVVSGPFSIRLTKYPSQHLTFNDAGDALTILLLDFPGILNLYRPQCVGISTYEEMLEL